jgi:hypothetical protein
VFFGMFRKITHTLIMICTKSFLKCL